MRYFGYILCEKNGTWVYGQHFRTNRFLSFIINAIRMKRKYKDSFVQIEI